MDEIGVIEILLLSAIPMGTRKMEWKEKTFTTIVQREGKFIFVEIPFPPREAWGAQPRYPVAGTINQFPVRGTLGASGQDYFLRLSSTWLKDSDIKIGETVTVRLSPEDR